MAINLRGTAVVADGSITEAKLANDSVSTAKIQTNAVIDTKIATDAVTTTKIATDAVTTVKIAADAVSVDKVTNDLATEHFFGTEVPFVITGTTETSIGEFHFTKSPSATETWQSLGYNLALQSDIVSNNASVKIYIDTVLFATQTTNSITSVYFDQDSVNISSLTDDNHLVEIKLVNDTVGGIATLPNTDIYFGKKPV